MNKKLGKIMKGLGSKFEFIGYNWAETVIAGVRLLFHEVDDLYCLVVACGLSDQRLLKKIFEEIREAGFGSKPYTSEGSWKHRNLNIYVFFAENAEEAWLQVSTDNLVINSIAKIDRLTHHWE